MTEPILYHYDQFPPKTLDWEKLIPLIGPASAAIARYDGILSAIPNAAVLLSPLTTQEAVLSSRIEGTVTTMGEVLEYEAKGAKDDLTPERKADINEVLNYRRAMRNAINLLETLPLCQRVIKEAHRILMDGVRGHGKSPGEYRKGPNWIGPPGCTIEEARFVPISADRLVEGMSVWEKYIHSEAPDRLIQLALLHAEFEALHPFLDGNGRLGRMCVPLFMFQSGLIQSPMFYISAYFEANRDEYYERLMAVSRDNAWTAWCAYFLRAITSQAQENQEKATKILTLYDKKKGQLIEITHSQYAIHALDFLFGRPIFMATDFTNNEGIPSATAKRMLSLLREEDILKTIREPSGRRPAMYAFRELLNVAEGEDVF